MKQRHVSYAGIVTVETVVLFTCLMGALIIMCAYFQRGMQGGVMGVTRSIGLQFDVNNYKEEQTMLQSSSIHNHVLAPMVEAELLKQVVPNDGTFNPEMLLVNLPVGPVPREPASKDYSASSWWTMDQPGAPVSIGGQSPSKNFYDTIP